MLPNILKVKVEIELKKDNPIKVYEWIGDKSSPSWHTSHFYKCYILLYEKQTDTHTLVPFPVKII